MTHAYRLFKIALLQKYPTCEICGIRQASQVNHCLYHVHGGIFDSFENCHSSCEQCHNARGHSRANKARHWQKRFDEGFEMCAWNMQVVETRREWWV